jgi:hypothetical protein
MIDATPSDADRFTPARAQRRNPQGNQCVGGLLPETGAASYRNSHFGHSIDKIATPRVFLASVCEDLDRSAITDMTGVLVRHWIQFCKGVLHTVDLSIDQNYALCAVKGIASIDDDAISHRQSCQNLDLGDTRLTQMNWPALGNIVMNNVGKAAPIHVDETPTIDHEDIVTPVDKNPNG